MLNVRNTLIYKYINKYEANLETKKKDCNKTSVKIIAHDMNAGLTSLASIIVRIGQIAISDINLS